MATPSTRQAIVQAILKRRSTESLQREKKSMKGYVPSYLEGDEKCVVCGDKATGYHYKCITCEGCKGFFRRTVQKNLEGSYQCKHSSTCDINKVTRNQCQLCRYNKCILVGMAKDHEEKRLAKRKLIEQNRELRRHKELSQMMAQCGWRIERPTDDERRLIHDVTQAFFQANDIQNSSLSSVSEGGAIAEKFSSALTAAITNVVDFAKRIPLFVNHVCCMEVITLRCVTSYKNTTKQVTLFPTVDVTKDQLRFTRLEPFSESLFALAEHLNSMELTPVEVALLQAALIFSGDRPGIAERIRLDNAQDTILRAFEHHLNEIWPHDPKYCPSLLMKLTDIRTVSSCLADTLMSMRMDDPQELGRLFCNGGTVPSLKSLQLQHPQLNHHHHHRIQQRTLSESLHNHSVHGLHHTVMKSFSLPHLNGFVTSPKPMDQIHFQNEIHTLNPTLNGKTRIDEIIKKTPPAQFTSDKTRNQVPKDSHTIPTQILATEINHRSDRENLYYSSNRNGVRLSTGNGVTTPISPEHIRYESYKNSHNKVFERVTKTLRTSSSLSDDTNRMSRSHSITPTLISSPQSHSVPSSPCKNDGSRGVCHIFERNFVPIVTRQVINSQIVTQNGHSQSDSRPPHRDFTKIRSIDFLVEHSPGTGLQNGTQYTNGRHHTNGKSHDGRFTMNGLHGVPYLIDARLPAIQLPKVNHVYNKNTLSPCNTAVPIKTVVNGNGHVKPNPIPSPIQNGCRPDRFESRLIQETVNHVTKRRADGSPTSPPSKVKRGDLNGVTQRVINGTRNGTKNVEFANTLTDSHKSSRLLVKSGLAAHIDGAHYGTLPHKRPKSC